MHHTVTYKATCKKKYNGCESAKKKNATETKIEIENERE